MSTTTSLQVDVTPYFYGDNLYIPVYIKGEEVFEGEVPISFLFQHFIECCNPYNDEDEAEMYNLIFALEEAIQQLTEALGDGE